MSLVVSDLSCGMTSSQSDARLPEIEALGTAGGENFLQASAEHAAAGMGWAFGCSLISNIPDGYVLEEFIIRGSAICYVSDGDNATPFSGEWKTAKGDSASYCTRAYVLKPETAAGFNGAVIVNWQNATGGFDVGAPINPEFGRGYAWVGVTTQKIGVDGTPGFIPGLPEWDEKRYGSMDHPGDAWSYDIFTQLGRALKARTETCRQLLGELQPDTIIAMGASQSAMRLSTYINAVHSHERVFDGFLLTIHWGISPPLEEVTLTESLEPDGDRLSAYLCQIRDDLNVPILVLATECESRYNFETRQPDSETFRFWEVAGASHQSPRMVSALRSIVSRDCLDFEWPVAEGTNTVDWDYIQSAAIRAIADWCKSGKAPSIQSRISMTGNTPESVERDEHGNVVGGIRIPELEAPIATHIAERTGIGMTDPAWLEGFAKPFSTEKLQALYPDGRAEAWNRAVDNLVTQGLVMREDESSLRNRVID